MALSANRTLKIRNVQGQRIETATVATGATIYKHALVALRANALRCLPAANATTTTFLGISDAQYSAASTARLYTECDVSIPFTTGVTAGNRDALAYCTDDEKVTTASTLGPPCGRFMEIDADNSANIWVHIGPVTAKASAS